MAGDNKGGTQMHGGGGVYNIFVALFNHLFQ